MHFKFATEVLEQSIQNSNDPSNRTKSPHCEAQDNICLLNVNSRSIGNKFPDFIHLLATYFPHISCVTETWLHADNYDSEVTPLGLYVVRADRRHGRGGA